MNKYVYMMKRIEEQARSRAHHKNKFYEKQVHEKGTYVWTTVECPSGPLKANTLVYKDTDDTLVVRFHSTDIARFYPDGMEHVESGYSSVTTRDRHNEVIVSGWRIHGEREPLITAPSGFSAQLQHECRTKGLYKFQYLHPFHEGAVMGWSPSHDETVWNILARLGSEEGNRLLRESLIKRSKMCGQHDECKLSEEMALLCPYDSLHKDAFEVMASELKCIEGKKFGGEVQRDLRKILETEARFTKAA